MRTKSLILLLEGCFLGLLLAVATSATASEAKLVPEQLILPRLATSNNPQGVEEEWKVRRLTPAGHEQFLALLEHSKYKFSRWLDIDQMHKERKKQSVVTSVKPERLQDQLVLAILNDRGKVLYQSDTPPGAAQKGGALTAWYSLPLVMDSTDACPYAVVNAASKTLLCYDYQLAFKAAYRIPLDDIRYAKSTFDGEQYTVWFFGRHYRGKPKTKTKRAAKRSPSKSLAPPARPVEAYGVRFHPRDATWEPLPVNRNNLLADLERVARSEAGERLRLQPGSLSMTPFRDLDEDEGFRVLIEAVATEHYDNRAVFSGTRVFFVSTMGTQGLGKIRQLPLWVVQEERRDAALNEKTGVFRFPRFMRERDVQPFSLGKNGFLLVFDAIYAVPRADGSYGRAANLIPMLLLFSGRDEPPRIIDLGGNHYKQQAERSFSTKDIRVLPVELIDRVGKTDFAFYTLCDDVNQRGRRWPCTAIMRLVY